MHQQANQKERSSNYALKGGKQRKTRVSRGNVPDGKRLGKHPTERGADQEKAIAQPKRPPKPLMQVRPPKGAEDTGAPRKVKRAKENGLAVRTTGLMTL